MSRKKTTAEFIEEARKIHGDKYDYSKVEYIKSNIKVCIICPIHGEFCQTPSKHLKGQGCPYCGIKKNTKNRTKTIEQIMFEFRQVHGNKYDYSKVEYINANTKVCIICPQHGEFWQTPYNHIKGHGCDACSHEKLGLKKRQKCNKNFIKKSKLVHGDKYDYSKVNYVKAKIDVCIICPEHGEFWQTPNKHLNGHGCPICKQSHLENEIMQFLKDNNVEYIPQHSFNWLKNKNSLHLDFYLPKYNVAIECQGLQHFEEVDYFGGKDNLKLTIKRDKLKNKLCKENNVKIFYYSDLGIEYPYKVYENKEELLKVIQE